MTTELSSLSVEEIFQYLESNNAEVVSEVQAMFHQNLSQTKDGWLVSGLYDYYLSTSSRNGLKLLTNIREPHERILCDKLAEGIRSSDKSSVLGAIQLLAHMVRKQPLWLHKVAQYQLFRDLLRLIKSECDVTILVPSLLLLVSILPALAAKVSPFLPEMFELFSRLCQYKYKEERSLQERSLQDVSATHLTAAIYSYFHRLYGMFPCNFLFFMRQQDYDHNNHNGVFNDIVGPLLSTVRLHPLLVTQGKDFEKTNARWKGLAEVHDVLADCSRYCVDVYESSSREEGGGVMALWSDRAEARSFGRPNSLESPPEAAVEATPDNTPYQTPVKDLHRPPHIRNLNFRSPGPSSPTKIITTPTKESSPFKFPDLERRDSLFGERPQIAVSKRDSLELAVPSLRSRPLPHHEDLHREEDAEVTSILGSCVAQHSTPQVSRTVSRLSEESEESVTELVTKVMTRVRRITLCQDANEDSHKGPGLVRRSASCPNISVPILVTSKTTNTKNKLRFSSGTQTENIPFFSYEDLLPFALPRKLGAAATEPLPGPQRLLENYIQGAVNSRDLKSQVQLLRSQLLFETGRRETLGARNRRLLGHTKNVREQEEKILALVDQLHMAREEISTLNTQLANVRSGKHKAETERAESCKHQDKMIQDLHLKLQELQTSNRELTENNEFKEMQVLESLAKCDKARSDLFQEQSKYNELKKMERSWQACQAELEALKLKYLLQGELVVRQKDCLENIPRAAREEEKRMLTESAAREIESLKSSLLHKSQEFAAAKAKSAELENKVNDLSEGIKSQQRMIQSVHEEYQEKMAVMESRQAAVRSINSHLESVVMELQDKLERLTRHSHKRSGASPSSDISNSLGSDTEEHMRRAMDSPPVQQAREVREIRGREIPGRGSSGVTVGSAYSVLHSQNSQNGNSH